MWRKVGGFVLISFFCFFVQTGCTFFNSNSNAENINSKTVESDNTPSEIPVIVTAAKLKKGDLVRQIKTEGVVVCREIFSIKAKVSGRVVEGVFENGKEVKKGDLLVSIDDRKYRLEMMQAESKLNKAIATLAVEEVSLKKKSKKSEEFLKKLKKLENEYKTEKIDFDTYIEKGFELRKEAAKKGLIRSSIVMERTGIASARYSLEQAKINLEYCHIKAPFEGITANCEVFKGKEVQVGDHLLDLLNKDSFRVKASIIESELKFLKKGKGVEVRFEAFPNKVFKGYIDEINPVIDEKTRTADAYIALKNAKNIYQGLYANVYIDTERIKNKFIVPNSAVLTREGRTLIFVVDETNHAKWVYVKVVGKNDFYSAIENASDYTTIKEGDLVIVSNNLTLGHGSLVEVKKVIN